MAEQDPGRPAKHAERGPVPAAAAPPAAVPTGMPPDLPADDSAYRRPVGLTDSFAQRPTPPPYTPPPPTASPEQRQAFGRPAGATGGYAPPAGDRVPPRPQSAPSVPWVMASAFGRTDPSGFDPAPGDRIDASFGDPESPWWKHGAARDPWRDPASPFWLGRGAVFAAGAPTQVAPTDDVEASEDEPDGEDDNAAKVIPIATGRAKYGLRVLGLSVLIALVAGAVGGYGGYFLGGKTHDALHHPDVSLPQATKGVVRAPGSIASIAAKIGPAVVSLAVTSADKTLSGVGSGVVIDNHGDVLTNNHVASVAKGGGTIIATFSDESTARAQIVGLDPISDLAVVKVPDSELTVAPLGTSSALQVGDPVIAIGSPLGLNGTVTSGIVSALDRPVHVFGDDGTSDAYLDAIQTDAAINPGNSGGALVDSTGAVVGINSAAALGTSNGQGGTTATSGIGYAIPIDYAREVAQELIATGKATHGSIGAQGRTAQAGLQSGAYLEQVAPGQAAAKAGLRDGDVIVVAAGRPITSYDELIVIVQEHKPGDAIAVTYFRGSNKLEATITLSAA